MSGGRFVLSDEDRGALDEFAEHADWCDYAEKSDEGCTPDFGCGVWKVRARMEAAVEAIVQRAINAALNDAADALDEVARTPRVWGAYPEAAGIVRRRAT